MLLGIANAVAPHKFARALARTSHPRPPGRQTEAILTGFNGAVNVRPGLVVDPVETSLDREPRQHSVLGAVAVARCHVDGTSLVVQRVRRVLALLVPALGHPQLHPRPLVHHRDRQGVELLLASLQHRALYITQYRR